MFFTFTNTFRCRNHHSVPFYSLSGIAKRRDGDSNPGYAFDVYTLSRRASSATRASLQIIIRTTSLGYFSCILSATLEHDGIIAHTNCDTKISIFFVTNTISIKKLSTFL